MVLSFLLLGQRLCATSDSRTQGLCPGLPGVYVASPPHVLTKTEPFLNHCWTLGSRLSWTGSTALAASSWKAAKHWCPSRAWMQGLQRDAWRLLVEAVDESQRARSLG